MATRQRKDSLRPGRPGWLPFCALLPLILAVFLLAGARQRQNAARLVPLEVVRRETPIPAATMAPPEETSAPTRESEAPASEITYVLNTSKRKLHRPDCPSVRDMKEKNRQDFSGTREEALAMGYAPCKRCNP